MANAKRDIRAQYGYVVYTCRRGLHFFDKMRVKIIDCPCDGDWDAIINGLECIGEPFFMRLSKSTPKACHLISVI